MLLEIVLIFLFGHVRKPNNKKHAFLFVLFFIFKTLCILFKKRSSRRISLEKAGTIFTKYKQCDWFEVYMSNFFIGLFS